MFCRKTRASASICASVLLYLVQCIYICTQLTFVFVWIAALTSVEQQPSPCCFASLLLDPLIKSNPLQWCTPSVFSNTCTVPANGIAATCQKPARPLVLQLVCAGDLPLHKLHCYTPTQWVVQNNTAVVRQGWLQDNTCVYTPSIP
jgi:hypothetical protein